MSARSRQYLVQIILAVGVAFGQAGIFGQSPPAPPLPPLPPLPPGARTNPPGSSATAPRAVTAPFLIPALPGNSLPSNATPPAGVRVIPPPPVIGAPPGVRVLPAQPFPNRGFGYNPAVQPKTPATNNPPAFAWEALSKEYFAKPGDTNAHLVFAVTNVSPSNLTIYSVRTSCGCTIAKVPTLPWKLAPKEKGEIDVTVDLRGKFGVLHKMVSVESSVGYNTLSVEIHLPPTPPVATAAPSPTQLNMDLANRARNISQALADRQAVFKNDCVNCHVQPATGKTGAALYQAACAICHDSPHRATMVPDLASVKSPPTENYWQTWISDGKDGTLMPAFGKGHGGPLSDEQIQSLVQYLADHFSKKQASSSLAVPLKN